MKKSVFLNSAAALLLLFAGACGTTVHKFEHAHSPYQGEENRSIKSLSEKEVDDYMNGRGMGFAKAAELNSFPGPMHVLELEQKLNLTAEQKSAVQNSFQKMKNEAVDLGNKIIEREKELNQMFAENKIDGALLERKTGEIAKLQGDLRRAHLEAHLETKQILSAAQVENYNQLRGYQK